MNDVPIYSKNTLEMGCSLMKTSALDLKDEDIEFLTSNTPYTATEIKDWYKSFQKECPNGKLNQKKFIDIYKLFFHHGNPEKFCAHVFRTFDEDGSGSITFKEFLLAIGITTGMLNHPPAACYAQMSKYYKRID